ncbi:MAG: serine hydrolase [Spirochaetota bacterium]
MLSKRNFSILLLILIIFLPLLYLYFPQAETEIDIGGCRPSGLLLLGKSPSPQKSPALADAPIFGDSDSSPLSAPGAILYAVPAAPEDFNAFHNRRGQILWQRDAYTPRSTASMTKLMSLFLVLEHLRGRDLQELQTVPRNGSAARQPPDAAVAGLQEGRERSWEELLVYVIVVSAKDAIQTLAILVSREQDANPRLSEAEALQYFVRRMNSRAAELGLASARFVDTGGWSPENRISPQDMARLAAIYSHQFPQTRTWHQQTSVRPGKRQKNNTNLLLPYYPEVEGLKTGFTYEAGFNFVAVARRRNWRYIAVVMGIEAPSVGQGLQRRAAEAEALLNWAMENFAPLDAARKTPLQIITRQGIPTLTDSDLPNIPRQPYLLRVKGRQGLLSIGEPLAPPYWKKGDLSWYFYWNENGPNYGEIRSHRFGSPLARFAIPRRPGLSGVVRAE